ncbi:MAG TPA: sugar ABC transporter substrate-binding protein [Chloroflexota bacterium]|nr:sugar ABC transporter substrate-binding protein [Chloroflexota bacterium]
MTAHTRRRALSLAAAFPVLAACAPGAGTTDTAPPAGAIKPGTKLSFAFGTAADQAAVMTRAAQEASKKWPGLTVDFINTQGGTPGHNDKIQTSIAAGTPIDVFTLNPNELPSFVENKQVRAIDDLIRRDKYDPSDFFEKCYGQYKWKGKQYALPRGFGNQDVYYNTALWSAAGNKPLPYDWNAKDWTAQEFLDSALRLTRLSGAQQVWGWNQGTGLRQWAPWVWIFGGDVLDKNGETCILDQPPAVEGLQFLQDLMHRHRVMPPPSAKVNTMMAMGNGQLGMAMGIPAEIGRYRAIPGLAFDVAPVPRQAARLTSGGGIAWHTAVNTPFPNEAWELAKWISSKEVQTWECEVGGTAPPRKSVIKAPCFNDRSQQPKGLDVFLQAPDFVHVDPQHPKWNDGETLLIEAFAALWDGSKPVRQIVNDVVPQINRILKTAAK